MPTLKNTPTLPEKHIDVDRIKSKIEPLAERLGELQNHLYAGKKNSVLVILQGLDAAGKDNTVKHVFSGVNPSGCRVKGFKAPSEEEKAHDFLWRIHRECPERGMIQIFNRSHYEDVLVPVVNGTLSKSELKQRYQAINNFEQMLIDNGTAVFKFFLHVSPEEQQKRFDDRLLDSAKRYKYNPQDLDVFAQRDLYLKQYEKMFEHCQQAAPWHLIPADSKPAKNLQILKVLVKELEHLLKPSVAKLAEA